MTPRQHWLDLVARRLAGRRVVLGSFGRGILGAVAVALAGGVRQEAEAAPRYKIRKATTTEKAALAKKAKSNSDYALLRNTAIGRGLSAQAATAFVLLDRGTVAVQVWNEPYRPAAARKARAPAPAFKEATVQFFKNQGAAAGEKLTAKYIKQSGETIFFQDQKYGQVRQIYRAPPKLNDICSIACGVYDGSRTSGVSCALVSQMLAAVRCATPAGFTDCLIDGVSSESSVCAMINSTCNSSLCITARCASGGLELPVPSAGLKTNFCCPSGGAWTGCFATSGYAAGCCPAGSTECRCVGEVCGCRLISGP